MKKKRPIKINLTYNTPSPEAINRFTESVMVWYNNATESSKKSTNQEGNAA